jgi:hypothetical protein
MREFTVAIACRVLGRGAEVMSHPLVAFSHIIEEPRKVSLTVAVVRLELAGAVTGFMVAYFIGTEDQPQIFQIIVKVRNISTP